MHELASSLIIIGILITVAAFAWNRTRKKPMDFRAFFMMGIVWFLMGLPLMNFMDYSVSAMGLLFVITGLANKGKWKKNAANWKRMNKGEKFILIMIMSIVTMLFIMGILIYMLVESGAVLA